MNGSNRSPSVASNATRTQLIASQSHLEDEEDQAAQLSNLLEYASLGMLVNKNIGPFVGDVDPEDHLNYQTIPFDHKQCLLKIQKLELLAGEITHLPESIGDLLNLRKLSISHNKLLSLPSSIGKLRDLRHLDASHNKLATLPDTIENLVYLTRLNLCRNSLEVLPNSLGNLVCLVDLNLSYNILKSMPDSLGNLTNLRKLNLCSNLVFSLPESIGGLIKLDDLDLSRNKLAFLPDSIGNMRMLRHMSIDNNNLTILPSTIGQLKDLRSLCAIFNQLISLPDTMGNLVKLVNVLVSSNKLTLIPNAMAKLRRSLKTLDLRRNNISEFGHGLALGRHELNVVFETSVCLEVSADAPTKEVRTVEEIYNELEGKAIHWNFNTLKSLKASQIKEPNLNKLNGIQERGVLEEKVKYKDVVPGYGTSFVYNKRATWNIELTKWPKLDGLPTETHENRFQQNIQDLSILPHSPTSKTGQNGSLDEFIRLIIVQEKERMFDIAIEALNTTNDEGLSALWKYEMQHEIGFEVNRSSLTHYNLKGHPSIILSMFYEKFTPEHIISRLKEQINSIKPILSEACRAIRENNQIDEETKKEMYSTWPEKTTGDVPITEQFVKCILVESSIIVERNNKTMANSVIFLYFVVTAMCTGERLLIKLATAERPLFQLLFTDFPRFWDRLWSIIQDCSFFCLGVSFLCFLLSDTLIQYRKAKAYKRMLTENIIKSLEKELSIRSGNSI